MRRLKFATARSFETRMKFICYDSLGFVLSAPVKKDMSTKSLLVLNPDKLFEENGIDKIKLIQIQIQTEIEKKKEELRTMVGERYRDLLKAADTITEMRQTADGIVSHIGRISTLCNGLQKKKLLGVKRPDRTSLIYTEDLQDISKIIEIKILLSLPEQIWIAIDNKNYLLGAELFLFANHIHLNISISQNAKMIEEEFPVVSKQWEVIATYQALIINGAYDQLKIIDLPYEKAGGCLTCITFLDVISHEKLIDQYLNLRMLKLQETLQSDDVIRNKLKHIVILLQHTLSVIFYCFLAQPDGKCLIDNEIEKIVKENAKPTLTKITQASSFYDYYLSPLIKDFHPSIKKEIKCSDKETVAFKIQLWLKNVKDLMEVELTKLLKLVNDIKRLHKIIKEDILILEYPNNWNSIINSLLNVNNLNIYEEYMKSIVTKRVKEIIETVWQNCILNLMSTLNEIDKEISRERGIKQMENDIRWYVWKENIMDTHECLRLKTQGFTFRITRLCSGLDNSLKQLLEEVELYAGENLSDPKIDNRSDFAEILLFLNRCSYEMLKRLAGKIKESCKKEGNLISESGIIVRARFLQSLSSLIPSLEKCLRQSQRQSLKELPENDLLNVWQDSCSLLNEESIQVWQLWKNLTAAKLHNLIKSKLSSKISLRTLLASKPLNEVIDIEEQTEDGTRVQSEIRVPSQPSLPLQDLLFQACQIINAVVPHTLPRKIHGDLIDTFVKNILEHYEEWSQSETIYQSQAWQLLMDIRFINLLLITQENKNLSQSICDALEKIIDPFDLDVHYPYLQNCVKKSTQRLQATLGVLINFREKLPILNGLKLTQNASGGKIEEPNILVMSDKVPWFALLAVSSQTSETPISKESTPEKMVKMKEKESRKESKSRDFVKSANAFLNAMTSRWS